jgi:hypothetical protein
MYLLVDAPDTVFDNARMTNEFGSDDTSTPEQWDRVAGTMEVGVGKSVCGRPGEGRRAEILLKTKVVLEKDGVGSSKIESGVGVEEALGRIETGTCTFLDLEGGIRLAVCSASRLGKLPLECRVFAQS